jgi:nitrite reductase (NO-forming)
MRNSAICIILLLLVACRADEPRPSGSQEPLPAPSAVPAQSPSPVSHGEAPIGHATTQPDRAANAPPLAVMRYHRIRMITAHVRHEVAPGIVYDAWTFDSIIPGPTIRVTAGDTVDFTLVNRAPIPHSMDFHAAEIAPDRAYRNVMPNDSVHFRFVARVPGAFMYHCGTAPVASHIANGMYGALVVDPKGGRPPADEFVLVQSEFYVSLPQGRDSLRTMDWGKVLNASPDYVVFNGVSARYATSPIPVAPKRPLRLFVVNAGPNRVSAFHVVGAIFDRVHVDGFGAPLRGLQTWNVPVGGGAIFDLTLAEDGIYPFVTHAFADATKGVVGVLRAGTPSGTAH